MEFPYRKLLLFLLVVMLVAIFTVVRIHSRVRTNNIVILFFLVQVYTFIWKYYLVKFVINTPVGKYSVQEQDFLKIRHWCIYLPIFSLKDVRALPRVRS